MELRFTVLKRAESIDTIPSNFSRWLDRGQVIRAGSRTGYAETNHNVSSLVGWEPRCDWSAAVFLAAR